MVKQVVLNGKFLIKKNPRGVQRYSKEIFRSLDRLVKEENVVMLVPHTDAKLPHYENIKIVEYGGKITTKFWQTLAFQVYILKNHALAVCLSDGIPLITPGICAIHDMGFAAKKQGFHSLKAWLSNRFDTLTNWRIAKSAGKIITVSEFSRKNICAYYHLAEERVVVAYNAWQHLQDIGFDDSVFDQNRNIKKGEYFFSLGGEDKTKNLLWIYKMALKYPESTFVLAGPGMGTSNTERIDWDSLQNVISLGFVSDEQIRSLMRSCKAFLFPSLYEGFGIPPLEAISAGARVLCSNAACLPEIYKDSVTYFDPLDYDADLERLLARPQEKAKALLEDYSWDKSAEIIWNVILEERKIR